MRKGYVKRTPSEQQARMSGAAPRKYTRMLRA